ncbi:unnamed protein product, partial [Rotaria magnacalcarata]
MTWNRPEEELRKFLDDVNTWHPNIKLDYKIGRSLPFLDVQLTNNNGILSTSVYHKPAAEPYVTPFISDHPRHVFINIIQTSLARAIRYSSTREAFNCERRYIKLMSTNTSSITSGIECIATVDIDNGPVADETKQPNESTTKLDTTTITNYEEKLFLHYTHEKRFNVFKRDMHHVYEHTFKSTPAMYTKLIVGNRNRRQASDELIHKRPTQAFLLNDISQTAGFFFFGGVVVGHTVAAVDET